MFYSLCEEYSSYRIYHDSVSSYYEKFADGKVVCIDEEIPFEIPESWEWCRINHLFLHTSGKQQSSNNKGNGTPQKFITTSNLYWGRFELNNVKVMNFTEDEVKNCSATKGDLLVCEGGAGYGRSAIWDKEYDICLQNHVHRLRPLIDGICEYVYYFIYLLKESNQLVSVGTAMPGLSANRLKGMLLPLPPYQEQCRIVSKLKEVFPYVERFSETEDALSRLNSEIRVCLKKSILQEAIQGKLVPQDPADEPASTLLERIKEEKQRLVKEGKLKKKDVTDSIIFKGDDNKYYEKKAKDTVCIDDEIQFEIPESWEWVRLSDVVQVNPKNDVPDNTLAAFIPMERIDATYLSSFTYLERKWGNIKSGFTHFADGDVAFAKITPCFQNRKSMILKGLPNGVGAGTTELKVLRPYADTIDREYLLFFLESSYFVEEATFKGTANQQRITSGYMENKLFPLPPLSEQRRISEKIKESYKRIGL